LTNFGRSAVAVTQEKGYIPLRKALKDYLREQGSTLSDLLDLMDEEKRGLSEALWERVQLTNQQRRFLEQSFTSRDLMLLLFVAQAFYIINPSGMYKGMVVEPTRDEVMLGQKISYEGCRLILKALASAT
jgi:hypothetical protein